MRIRKETSTLRCNKDFPVKSGDTLFIRDRSGRVVERVEVKGMSFLTALERPNKVVYDTLRVIIDRRLP